MKGRFLRFTGSRKRYYKRKTT